MTNTSKRFLTTFSIVFKRVGGAENAVYLTHDHYYKDISHLSVEERSKTNFDHPDSLDTGLLVQHLRELKSGKTADLPNYDFATHSRTPITSLVHPKPIIIVEGILILTSTDLCDECDMKVFVVRNFVKGCCGGSFYDYSYPRFPSCVNRRTQIVILES